MGPQLDIVNPVLWEIGHVGWFHEYWTLRHAHGRAPLIERGDRLWDSSAVRARHALAARPARPRRHFRYLADVLARQEDRLGGTVDDDARYFYELAIRHEDMHVEALDLFAPDAGLCAAAGLGDAPPRRRRAPCRAMSPCRAGRWRLGSTAADGFVFDNEKWAHETVLAPFRIARAPVTNAEFAAFVEAGGYRVREFWSDAGWAWRQRRNAERPVYWQAEARRRVDAPALSRGRGAAAARAGRASSTGSRPRPGAAGPDGACRAKPNGRPPRSASRRRTAPDWPTRRRRWPWGDEPPTPDRANLDFAFDGPVDVAACAGGDSAFGCRQMIGNVWEWTASDFLPFAGFAADPYKDYSQPWFGTRKVLRGGCWATSARIARPAYRNFFTPDRSDVFAGFRSCAP